MVISWGRDTLSLGNDNLLIIFFCSFDNFHHESFRRWLVVTITGKLIFRMIEIKFIFFACFLSYVPEITSEQVTTFLKNNPDFLERHLMEEVELDQLERWMIRRTQRAKKLAQPTTTKNGRKTSLSRYYIVLGTLVIINKMIYFVVTGKYSIILDKVFY